MDLFLFCFHFYMLCTCPYVYVNASVYFDISVRKSEFSLVAMAISITLHSICLFVFFLYFHLEFSFLHWKRALVFRSLLTTCTHTAGFVSLFFVHSLLLFLLLRIALFWFLFNTNYEIFQYAHFFTTKNSHCSFIQKQYTSKANMKNPILNAKPSKKTLINKIKSEYRRGEHKHSVHIDFEKIIIFFRNALYCERIFQ